jgi:NADH:ubiquinone oxidoreductase subunit F (NADH-binding)
VTARLRLVTLDDGCEPALLAHAVSYLGPGHSGLTELEPQSLRAHWQRYGARPERRPRPPGEDLIDALHKIALTGRGGGHFPTAAKWQAIRAATGPRPLVVANGAEGEPLSRKDSALLELRPHLILDGLACTAEAVDAAEAVVWLHEGDHLARSAVSRALAERQSHVHEVPIRIALGPDRYLSGESSAVVRGVGGGPALPAFRPVPGPSRSPDGRPTLVHNVETLARIALAARGEDAVSSALVSVSSGDTIVVLELPDTCSVQDAVRRALGGTDPQAVLLGGYGGSWLSWEAAAGATLSEPQLRAGGLSLGAGVIAALLPGQCGIARVAQIARYLAESSARQCGPCLFGLDAIADSLHRLAKGGRRHRHEVTRLTGFLAEVRGRGACGHPDGAVRMVASALETFGADAQAHLDGRCVHEAPTGRGRG